jgi:hypothetical protein
MRSRCVIAGPAAVLAAAAALRILGGGSFRRGSRPLLHRLQSLCAPAPIKAVRCARAHHLPQPVYPNSLRSVWTMQDNDKYSRAHLPGRRSARLMSVPLQEVHTGASSPPAAFGACCASRAHSACSRPSSSSEGPSPLPLPCPVACARSRCTAPRAPSVVTSQRARGSAASVDSRQSPRPRSPVQAWPPAHRPCTGRASGRGAHAAAQRLRMHAERADLGEVRRGDHIVRQRQEPVQARPQPLRLHQDGDAPLPAFPL